MSHFDISLHDMSSSEAESGSESECINNYDEDLISTDGTDMMFEYLANYDKVIDVEKKPIYSETEDLKIETISSTPKINAAVSSDTDMMFELLANKEKLNHITISSSSVNMGLPKIKNDDIFVASESIKQITKKKKTISCGPKYVIVDDDFNTTDSLLDQIISDISGLKSSISIDKKNYPINLQGRLNKINMAIKGLGEIRNSILNKLADVDTESSIGSYTEKEMSYSSPSENIINLIKK